MIAKVIFSLVLAVSQIHAAPIAGLASRANAKACFMIGNTDVGAEVNGGVPALAAAVTCANTKVLSTAVPDVSSGGVSFSSINFKDSKSSPLGFALQKFALPANPADGDLALIQNQLNVYMAMEAGLRSVKSGQVTAIKVPRFFLMMQKARVLTAQGKTDLGDSVEGGERLTSVDHQVQKVIKNAKSKATAAELAALNALVA